MDFIIQSRIRSSHLSPCPPSPTHRSWHCLVLSIPLCSVCMERSIHLYPLLLMQVQVPQVSSHPWFSCTVLANIPSVTCRQRSQLFLLLLSSTALCSHRPNQRPCSLLHWSNKINQASFVSCGRQHSPAVMAMLSRLCPSLLAGSLSSFSNYTTLSFQGPLLSASLLVTSLDQQHQHTGIF